MSRRNDVEGSRHERRRGVHVITAVRRGSGGKKRKYAGCTLDFLLPSPCFRRGEPAEKVGKEQGDKDGELLSVIWQVTSCHVSTGYKVCISLYGLGVARRSPTATPTSTTTTREVSFVHKRGWRSRVTWHAHLGVRKGKPDANEEKRGTYRVSRN